MKINATFLIIAGLYFNVNWYLLLKLNGGYSIIAWISLILYFTICILQYTKINVAIIERLTILCIGIALELFFFRFSIVKYSDFDSGFVTMIGLWINFAAFFPLLIISKLKSIPMAIFTLGLSAPLSYWAGSNISTSITPINKVVPIISIAIAWALCAILFVKINRNFEGKSS